MTYDAVVCGGGIVGAAVALELSTRGLSVLVLEPHSIGSGATAEGMGHIMVATDTPGLASLTSYSQQLWEELKPRLDESCEWRETGTLWAALNDSEMAEAAKKQADYSALGLRAEVWDGPQARKEEPMLGDSVVGGLHVPGDSVIYTVNAARWMIDLAKSQGAEVRIGSQATRIGEGWVELTSGERNECGIVINAAGAQAASLTPGVPISPRRGHLIITERIKTPVRRQIIELGYLKKAKGMDKESVAFNVQPRATGQLLIGSSREFTGWDRSVDRRIVARMLSRAIEYVPELAHVQALRIWTGFRPAVHDGVPLIGRAPDAEKVFLCAGHEGLGITTATGSAKILAAQIMGEESPIDDTPYRADRKVASLD